MADAKPTRYRMYKWPLIDDFLSKAVISLDDRDAPILAEFRLNEVNHSEQVREMLHLATSLGGTNADVLENGTTRMPVGQYESIIGVTFDLDEPFSTG